MIVCNRCGKENQDHYKFCLGCGAELTLPVAPPGDVGMMKTVMADMPQSRPGYSTPPPAAAAAAAPVAASPVAAYSAPVAASRRCPSCSTEVPHGFRFCGSCGYRMDEQSGLNQMPPAPAATPAAKRAIMTLIRPDGTEGGSHELVHGDNKVGRRFGTIFENDGYLSPVHAEINIRGTTALVRDLESLNGVFVKMTREEELQNGQILRIGQELLRFEFIPVPAPHPDGTELMGSPNPGYWGKLTVIIGREVTGAVFPLLGDSVTIGRERGEINFPDDGYVSGLHARVSIRDGRVFLADLGSSNGSFMKVNGERTIVPETFVLLGQQLFRVAF